MIGISSYDAGGAELISSYLLQNPGNYLYCLDGPATKIFKRKLGIKTSQLVTPEELVKHCDHVLCSGSWQSELELDVIDLARKHDKESTVYLDHWVNYPERFLRENRSSWPDHVWVTDQYAYQIAKQKLPTSVNIIIKGNPIQTEIENRFAKHALPLLQKQLSILYVSEPTSRHALHSFGDPNHFGYTEFEALEYAIEQLNQIPYPIKMLMRYHPAEEEGKYDQVLEKAQFQVEFSHSSTLLDDFETANIVIGATTMAIALAMYAGRYVFTSLPKPGLNNPLPFKEIQPVTELQHFIKDKLAGELTSR